MMGPGMMQAVNAAHAVTDLFDKDEDLIHEADEIATEVAYACGWSQDSESGEWLDGDGDRSESPLDLLIQYGLESTMREEITDQIIAAYNARKDAT